ncbi:restriction endonuclease subunit S [Paracoccus cavernae]|uniref:restriction endonuclease subunit S n=1 Tax=Paracoccus cavernae TaxID=1571207 RepID=UPI0035F2A2BA
MATDLRPLRLGDYCRKIGSGATPRGGKDAYLPSGPFSLIRSQNVYNDRFSVSGLAYISQEQANALKAVEVLAGDVLVNITGDSVARVCQVDPSILPARVNQHVAIIRPDNENIDAGFLRYWFVTHETQNSLLALASAGATRPALTKAMLENLEVPRIGIYDQRAIASVLSALDDKIGLNRRMNETLEGIAQAIFRDWFVDFGPVRRRATGEADPVAIMGGLTPDPTRAAELAPLFPGAFGDDGLPVGWKAGTLDRLALVNPESWKTKNHPAQVEYVDLSNTKWGTIEATAILMWEAAPSRARRIARTGDTIVGTVRPGNGSYAYIGRDGYTASTGFAVLRPKQAIFTDVVYVAATAADNITRLANLADGHGGAYPAVNPDVVAATSFPVVPDDLLAAFSTLASPLRAKVEQAKIEIRTLAETRDYLLPRLMSGAVRVAPKVEAG